MHKRLALLAIPALLLSGQAIAQNNTDAAPLQFEEVWETWSPGWSSGDIAKVAESFIGTWKTSAAVGETGEGSGTTDMLMIVKPAPVEGVSDALYVEQYRADSPGKPFRQAVMQLYSYKDGHRLRTYEIVADDTRKGVLVGMGYMPEAFPELSRDELIATLDLDVSPTSDGFEAETPYPYPTGTNGAVEMTSTVTVSGDTMTTADRGFNAEGDVVWGAGNNDAYEWTRADDWASVERKEGGLGIITLANPEDDAPVDGGRVFVHYTGWTADGNKFDSSYDKGQPWPLTWPVDQLRVIEGWKQSFGGITKGTARKLVIPAPLAYGDRGVPQSGIAPGATLYFNIDVVAVQAPATAPNAGPSAGQD